MERESEEEVITKEIEMKNERIILKTYFPVPENLPPKAEGSIRFVVLSDTHSLHNQIPKVPEGDILLHAGDFTKQGSVNDIISFNEFIGKLPHKHKIVIGGNHDVTLDVPFYESGNTWRRFHKVKQDVKLAQASLTNCTYLLDSSINIEGIHIYGSPWQPTYEHWGFNLDRGAPIKEKWDLIPDGVDVLLTHGPPECHLGKTKKGGLDAGCRDLHMTILKKKPIVHVFGHIHEGYGISKNDHTLFINGSTCNFIYKPHNPPIVFDLTKL